MVTEEEEEVEEEEEDEEEVEVEVEKGEVEEEEEMVGEWTKSRTLGEKIWYQWHKWQISFSWASEIVVILEVLQHWYWCD